MMECHPIEVRPYQLLCLFCRQGRPDGMRPYTHESRLVEIESAVKQDPIIPLTLRCNTNSVFRYQNPGREYDTPEGELYNDLRDLSILQRLGMVPGTTLPAIDIFDCVLRAIPACGGICGYPEDEAPGWPRCGFADSGNYERGISLGISAIVPVRTSAEKAKAKQTSAKACHGTSRLKIRPHHLLCLTCFHDGRSDETLAPIEEDNLCECIRAMQLNPDIPVELIAGPCMVCPPCSHFHKPTGLCVGGRSMGLRDDKKDLDTLRWTGLRYGDVKPAREMLQCVYRALRSTKEICGYGDGEERSREWSICGSTSTASFGRGRQAGLGVNGVTVPSDLDG